MSTPNSSVPPPPLPPLAFPSCHLELLPVRGAAEGILQQRTAPTHPSPHPSPSSNLELFPIGRAAEGILRQGAAPKHILWQRAPSKRVLRQGSAAPEGGAGGGFT